MHAYAAILKGIGRVWVVGHHADRLRQAERIGTIPIDTNGRPPGFVVSYELSLDEASTAYEYFDNRDAGWTKVVLHPNGHH